jgi:hypothetical protein
MQRAVDASRSSNVRNGKRRKRLRHAGSKN